MTIGTIIEGKIGSIVSCEAGATVEEAARLLAQHRIGAMPVFENGRLAGIFSERDLLYCIAREGAAVLARRVGEVMTAPAITVEPDSGVLDALALMTRRRIRHLPVARGEEVHGFVSIGDLVKHRLERVEAEAEQMRQYIQTA
ncbi:MAG: CBS domain-containing protein [Candidatus Andeanibacterium colombiense]|uniref:CBS domain-containing protein n=1 Tax=Candidatus Andeanibacterium colombiense TaxID=3121345 RepID=A0AAJ5X437_9SPHN|nr:MAG: CBS domain-containing protein [Sphingomonadaceae bacterium]